MGLVSEAGCHERGMRMAANSCRPSNAPRGVVSNTQVEPGPPARARDHGRTAARALPSSAARTKWRACARRGPRGHTAAPAARPLAQGSPLSQEGAPSPRQLSPTLSRGCRREVAAPLRCRPQSSPMPLPIWPLQAAEHPQLDFSPLELYCAQQGPQWSAGGADDGKWWHHGHRSGSRRRRHQCHRAQGQPRPRPTARCRGGARCRRSPHRTKGDGFWSSSGSPMCSYIHYGSILGRPAHTAPAPGPPRGGVSQFALRAGKAVKMFYLLYSFTHRRQSRRVRTSPRPRLGWAEPEAQRTSQTTHQFHQCHSHETDPPQPISGIGNTAPTVLPETRELRADTRGWAGGVLERTRSPSRPAVLCFTPSHRPCQVHTAHAR